MSGLTYESSGVNYDRLDAFKRACQHAAGATAAALAVHKFSEPPGIRGESAYLIDAGDHYLAHVEEGLGTKNLVADAMLALTGKCHYRSIGIDTVATIVNDLITTGALPVSIAMHAAVGDSDWFKHTRRCEDLAAGFAAACLQSDAVWGGGETPTLKDIVSPETIVLAGSAIGRLAPKSNRIVGDLCDGDAIVFLASSGVQTNGLTLCRKLAESLPDGYRSDCHGRPYGEVLLDPSVIYVKFIAGLQAAGIRPHYAAHITGHGWRKIMRLDAPFVYRITQVREPLPIFKFIMKHGGVDEREAYGTFNMGAGFAVYVAPTELDATLKVARDTGYDAWQAGTVVKQGARKAVEILPLDITYESDTLKVR